MTKQIVPDEVVARWYCQWEREAKNELQAIYIANRAAAWALEIALAKLQAEYVAADETGEHDDIVYNAAVDHCIDAVRALISPSRELAGTGGDDGQ